MDSFDFIIFVLIVVAVVFLVRGMRKAKESDKPDQATAQTPTLGTTTIVDGDKQQIVDDIKSTQTSRVVDQVAILEDLGQTTQNYRQFCELAGTTQAAGGVTAPYSKRQVAYYDVRCYKIERVNGRELETLVAQERSIEPFYFTDSSCDTKVHVALDTFGRNVILVNSMNHIEGPTSDFSKAISKSTSALSGGGTAKLMVADAARGLHAGLRNVWSWTLLAPERARAAMDAAFGFAGLRLTPAFADVGRALQPVFAGAGLGHGVAFAGAGAFPAGNAVTPGRDASQLSHAPGFHFAVGPGKPAQGGFSKPTTQHGFGGRPSSQHPIGSGKPQQHTTQVSLGGSKPPQSAHASLGGSKPSQTGFTVSTGKIPSGLDTFLGLGGTGMGGLQQNPYLGGPMSPYYGGFGTGKPSSNDLGSTLLNIGLSALLASMTSGSGSSTHTTNHAPYPSAPSYTGGAPAASYTQTNNTFMGYRIVEDVVPLNYPVYCIGDLYKNGDKVYMGKAMGTVSQSYYFATKLETEVLEHLQK